jgi:hypothetical protein
VALKHFAKLEGEAKHAEVKVRQARKIRLRYWSGVETLQ